MSWWGKLLGGAFGFMLGGPLGALIGAALGHGFDRGIDDGARGAPGWRLGSAQERAQTAFFTATFSVMGHVAKADGRVSPEEIALATQVMNEMGLAPAMRRVARRLFSEGKAAGFPIEEVLDQLRSECRYSGNLLRMFVELQIHAAYADGHMHAAERAVLRRICEHLHLDEDELEHLESGVRAARHAAGRDRGISETDAYAILEIEPTASDAEVKRAYRRQMNRHHPDKLVSKGLPDEMMKVATERTHQIKQAYERIKEIRSP